MLKRRHFSILSLLIPLSLVLLLLFSLFSFLTILLPPTPTPTPTTEPTAEPTIEPTVELTEEPTDEPTIEPTTEPTAEPTTEPTIEPTIEPTTEPTTPSPTPPPRPATIIYVQSNGRDHYLGIVRSDGSPINLELHRYAAAPALSPDKSTIAFFGEPSINQLGGVYSAGNGIWLTDIDGRNPRQLVSIDNVKNIAWSPDSTKLAFEIGLPSPPNQVIVIDAQGGRDISRFSGQQPAWSPNSQKLVIRACAPDCGLWIVGFDGSGWRQITFNSKDSYPTWSPTGEYLAFTSWSNNDWEIYRLRLADGELRNLTNRLGSDVTPVFSPDGQEIYLYTDYKGGGIHWDIVAINLNGSRERLIREGVGPSDDWGLARPAVR